MLDRRRARSTSRRILPLEGRRSSFWMPAFMAAAAARECGGVWEAGGDWERLRAGSLEDAMRARLGEADGDGDGGSEFRSGGMAGTRWPAQGYINAAGK